MSTDHNPAEGGYHANKYDAAIQRATDYLLRETGPDASAWEDMGMKDETHVYRKLDPANEWAVPLVKGVCRVPATSPEELMGIIQLAGARTKWDPRLEVGYPVKRFDRSTYEFYTVMKGMGWLVYGRDISGVHQTVRSVDGTGIVRLVQTSVEDPDLPEVSGKQRADLTVAAWILEPQSDGSTIANYIVKIDPKGSIPASMVHAVATETPTCAGRVAKFRKEIGFVPYTVLSKEESAYKTVFQTEEVYVDDREWTIFGLAQSGDAKEDFDIIYDSKGFYGGGHTVEVAGPGKSSVKVQDNQKGTIKVEVSGNQAFTITIS